MPIDAPPPLNAAQRKALLTEMSVIRTIAADAAAEQVHQTKKVLYFKSQVQRVQDEIDRLGEAGGSNGTIETQVTTEKGKRGREAESDNTAVDRRRSGAEVSIENEKDSNARPRRVFGGLSMLQGALSDVQRERDRQPGWRQTQKQQLFMQNKAKLDSLSKDITEFQQQMNEHETLLEKSTQHLEASREKLDKMKSIILRMRTEEEAYASAFFFHVGNEAGTSTNQLESLGTAQNYTIAFAPARHTSHSQEKMKCQLQQAIERYEHYRSEVNVVLLKLEERRDVLKEKRHGPKNLLEGSAEDTKFPGERIPIEKIDAFDEDAVDESSSSDFSNYGFEDGEEFLH